MIQPRKYQIESIESAFEHWDSGVRSVLVQVPTGGGKTYIGAECARRFNERGKRTLFAVHLREIVRQAKEEMASMTGLDVGMELAGEVSSVMFPEPIICASVQTMNGEGRLQKFNHEEFGLLIIDECFVGNTLVEGRRIDSIKVGDILSSGKVTRVFKKSARTLHHFILDSGKELICTPEHPIFNGTKFAPAKLFTAGSVMLSTTKYNEIQLCYLRSRDIEGQQSYPETLFEKRMRVGNESSSHKKNFLQTLGRDYKIPKDEWNVSTGSSGKGFNEVACNGMESDRSWRQRKTRAIATGCARLFAWVGYGSDSKNRNADRASKLLQNRYSEPLPQNSYRTGRGFSPPFVAQRTGQKENAIFGIERVASVTIYKQGSGDGFEQVCSDGFVYNLEVENSHIYLANEIVVHNCHHGVSKTWQNVLDYFPHAKVLCLTATPERSDKKKLGKIVDAIAYEYSLKQACDDGWLVKPRQLTIEIPGLDFRKIPRKQGELAKEELEAIMIKYATACAHRSVEAIFDLFPHELDSVPESEWNSYVADKTPKKTLIFCVTRLHAEKVRNALNSFREGLCGYVDGETPHIERRNTFRDFKHGDLACLANCAVTTEGYDNPFIKLILDMQPTMSHGRALQKWGRGTRTLPGTLDNLDTPEFRLEAIALSEKPYCIARGQQVLTDNGLIPIEQITRNHKVWDGVEFVTHSGIVFRGKKKVIKYAGLIATEDHRVWTEKGWQTFGVCARQQIPISITGIKGKEIREADGYFRRNPSRLNSWQSIFANALRLREDWHKGILKYNKGNGRMSHLRESNQGSTLALFARSGNVGALQQSQQGFLCAIRRTWHSVQISINSRCGNLDSGKSWTSSGPVNRSYKQRRELRSGEFEICLCESSMQQPEQKHRSEVSFLQNCLSRIPNVRLSLKKTSSERFESSGNCNESSWYEEDVFDIANAGPRNRFTVEGLLVSNCTVVDFTDNSRDHRLVTLLDIFGPDQPAAVKREVEKRMKERATDVETEIAVVLKERYERLGHTNFEETEIDGFTGKRKKKKLSKEQKEARRLALEAKGLSSKEYELLKKQKLQPEKFSIQENRQHIKTIRHRQLAGLCTYNQGFILMRYGYSKEHIKNMKFRDASLAIDSIARNGWRKVA